MASVDPLGKLLELLYCETENPPDHDTTTTPESEESSQINHPSLRRKTPKYAKKRGVVRSVWIASGLFMLVNPTLPVVIPTALFTTFLSFIILDETC